MTKSILLVLICLILVVYSKEVHGQASITTLATSSEYPGEYSVAVNKITGVVYAACRGICNSIGRCINGVVISIQNSAITILSNSRQCPAPSSATVDSSTGIVYAACFEKIIRIKNDDSNITVTTLINSTQCSIPSDVSMDDTTGILYAVCYGNTSGAVIRIDGDIVTTIVTSTQCVNPYGIFVDSSTQTVYAICNAGFEGGGLLQLQTILRSM